MAKIPFVLRSVQSTRLEAVMRQFVPFETALCASSGRTVYTFGIFVMYRENFYNSTGEIVGCFANNFFSCVNRSKAGINMASKMPAEIALQPSRLKVWLKLG